MKKKYILVTGGLGYIGSNTIAILKKNKLDIIILDNLSNSNKTSLRNLRKILNKKVIFCKKFDRETPFFQKNLTTLTT